MSQVEQKSAKSHLMYLLCVFTIHLADIFWLSFESASKNFVIFSFVKKNSKLTDRFRLRTCQLTLFSDRVVTGNTSLISGRLIKTMVNKFS